MDEKSTTKKQNQKNQNRDEIIADKKLDCVGLFCPIPVFDTTEAIEGMDDGEVLEVITDDPASIQDIPRWAKRRGHHLLRYKDAGDHYQFLIRK